MPGEVTFEEGEVIIGNRQRVGFTGENGVCALYLTDGTDPTVNLESNSNIYMTAGLLMQVESETLKHNVTVECTEIYKLMNHTVNTDKTSKVLGKYELEVGGLHKITSKAAQEITVTGGQTLTVTSGGQTFNVTGDRSLTVTGSVTETITQNRAVTVTGTNDVKVLSDCSWFNAAHSAKITVSADEELKLSNSLSVSIGAKEEASLSVAESLSVGGVVEQCLAVKRSTTAGLNMVNNLAVTIEKNTGVRTFQVGAADKYKTAMEQFDCQMAIYNAKIANWGAKLIKLA